MNRNFSERINILRFPLVAAIVFNHIYNTSISLSNGIVGIENSGPLSLIIRDYISRVLEGISTPFFFLTAGYLFFYGFNSLKDQYPKKVKSRIRTLAIPLVLWNSLYLLLFFLSQSIPYTSHFFSGFTSGVLSYSPVEYINAIVGITRNPIAAQFWYVRDLIVMVALAPLLYVVLRKAPIIILAAVLAIWFFGAWNIFIPGDRAVCFFSIGIFLGIRKYDFSSLDRYGLKITLLYFLVSLVDVFTIGKSYNPEVHNLGVLLGLTSAFYVAGLILGRKSISSYAQKLAPTSFFLVASHEPLQTLIKKITYYVLQPTTDLATITLYFAIPTIVIVICVAAYYYLLRFFPSLLRIITGGRSASDVRIGVNIAASADTVSLTPKESRAGS